MILYNEADLCGPVAQVYEDGPWL